jgi:hypothetical protein
MSSEEEDFSMPGHLGDGLPFLAPRLQHRMDQQRDGDRGSKARRRMDHYLRAISTTRPAGDSIPSS